MYFVRYAVHHRGFPLTSVGHITRPHCVARAVRGRHRIYQSGPAVYALWDFPMEETQSSHVSVLLQKAGRVAVAAAIGFGMAFSNIDMSHAEILQKQNLDPDIATVRSTLTEAWCTFLLPDLALLGLAVHGSCLYEDVTRVS